MQHGFAGPIDAQLEKKKEIKKFAQSFLFC